MFSILVDGTGLDGEEQGCSRKTIQCGIGVAWQVTILLCTFSLV